MATALRPIGHEERLSLVDHLTELRSRLVICVAGLVVAFAFCFWQNNAVLDIITKPVESTQNLESDADSDDPLEQSARFQRQLGQALAATGPALAGVSDALTTLRDGEGLSETQSDALAGPIARLDAATAQINEAAEFVPDDVGRNLVTLGVAEPFTATITIALYAALLLAMPLLLYQAYAFVLPAFSPTEKRIAFPLMLMVPLLFIGGAAFGYFVVLERAISFLQNFNDDSFDILLQARDYFRFAVLFIAGIGMLFQIPVAVLAVTRVGIVTVAQLRKHRGYIILGVAVLAAVATPTPDPVTMLMAMGPLIVLFELSILVAAWLDRVKPVDLGDEDGAEDEDELLAPDPKDR